MANKSVFDEFLKGIGNAVEDIRTKAIEEPWFGKVVTEREGLQTPSESEIGVAVSITAWPQAREMHQPGSGTHERDNPADIDIDR
jgi:hypothetical protein